MGNWQWRKNYIVEDIVVAFSRFLRVFVFREAKIASSLVNLLFPLAKKKIEKEKKFTHDFTCFLGTSQRLCINVNISHTYFLGQFFILLSFFQFANTETKPNSWRRKWNKACLELKCSSWVNWRGNSFNWGWQW